MATRIEGYDVDDTLVGREWVTRFGGAVKGRIIPWSVPTYTLVDVPVLDREPRNVRGINTGSFFFHERRRSMPGVAERLQRSADKGNKLIVISGRPLTVEWSDMTKKQLKREGFPINEVILTPLGMSTTMSKADAIRQLDVVEFSDDDLRTVLVLASLFPDRRFNYIRHGLTNIPVRRSQLGTFPNIREIPIQEWMQR